jgi:CRP-like cAMP-binding protein
VAAGKKRLAQLPRRPIGARATSPPVDKLAAAVVVTMTIAAVDWATLLTRSSRGKTVMECGDNHTIFTQGQPADSVYFLLRGKVRLAVATHEGKEAIVATLGPGQFLGEGCLAGQPLRMVTATSVGDSTLTKVEKPTMARMLHDEPGLAEMFAMQLLSRLIRYEADLIDQMFNSSEKRLARMLLLLSHFGKDSTTETVVAGINQEHLAQMVGTTRSRINLFMNRFRKLGFIDYNSEAGLTVHRSLLGVLRDEKSESVGRHWRHSTSARTRSLVTPLAMPASGTAPGPRGHSL